ncbi:MAG TPA: TrmH family RNA methyltransferase [Oligoflexia bacterium]|nr:TrmH family RNA methyltransferase [Oligoflexia bacterium]HMP27390.1 TrmH family RNA methyltransferase [Oligoflexia bacterium]
MRDNISDKTFDLFEVILVEPQESLNVGSVARAMKNLGFSRLSLVAPRGYSFEKAKITARWAEDLLAQAKIYNTFEESLSEATEVVGFAAKTESFAYENLLFGDWLEKVSPALNGRVALLFGPEDNGLHHCHLKECRYVVRLPSHQDYPAFNLAQSVLLALYEIARPELSVANRNNLGKANELPTWNEFFRLDAMIDEIILKRDFTRRNSNPRVVYELKNLLRRTAPDARQARILLSFFSEILKGLK